jgi:hypothetical protein
MGTLCGSVSVTQGARSCQPAEGGVKRLSCSGEQPDRGRAGVEPGPELADIKRHGGQPERGVEVGQFGLCYSPQ